MFYVGYINFVITLFIVTGILILRFDLNGYKMAKMNKEKKVARFLGWMNTGIGVLLLIANWIYTEYFL